MVTVAKLAQLFGCSKLSAILMQFPSLMTKRKCNLFLHSYAVPQVHGGCLKCKCKVHPALLGMNSRKHSTQTFSQLKQQKTARTVLYNLKQQGSVSHYISLFRLQLHQIPDMSAADQLALFRRGLINDIAWKLNIQHPKTLQEAMESAHRIELENQQQRFSRPRNFPQQQRSNPFQPWRYASQTPIYTPVFPNSSNQSYTGSAPMEISQMENAPQHEQQQDSATQGMINAMGMYNKKGGNGYRHSQQKQQFRSFASPSNLSKLTPEERSKLFAEGRCFRCRQSGHQSSQCPLNVSSSHSKNFNARQ